MTDSFRVVVNGNEKIIQHGAAQMEEPELTDSEKTLKLHNLIKRLGGSPNYANNKPTFNRVPNSNIGIHSASTSNNSTSENVIKMHHLLKRVAYNY